MKRTWRGAIASFGLAAALSTLAWPAGAQEMLPRTLTVTGQGMETVPVSRALVSLGVEVQAPTADAAQAEAAQRANAVVGLLRSRQVNNLQTTGVQLSPVYSNQSTGSGVSEVIAFRASNTVSFEVPVAAAGSLIDAVVKNGATRIDGLQFLAEDTDLMAARDRALRSATQDARRQADAVLDALGLTAGEVVGIQLDGSTMIPPRPEVAFRGVMADAPTPIEGGEQTIRASVILQIRY